MITQNTRVLTEQFIYKIDDEDMVNEILRGVSALKDIDDGTRERVLLWAQRVEAKRTQKEALNTIKEAKETDCVRHSRETNITLKDPLKEENKQKIQILWDRIPTETVSCL